MYWPRQESLLLIVISVAGCSLPEGHPPVARVTATPFAIPEHDGFQTDVVLDATASADPIDDPDDLRPLSYQWRLTGDEARVQAGSLTSATVTVRFLGDRPPTVTLTVTDEDGQSSSASENLQLTIPRAPD